ncbi:MULTISPECIES: hypothetical protein [Marinobacter]|uniref:hypothetical protein n=1 Tax=Marinobacter TaxID=2742 RepID=UPI001B2B283D|nr:hypothetical protein [Marinobacter sp.]MBO6811717.1 hypothetical protein [Marinobacter sp.]MBO6875054.1 hypothetical protein [Marinobacter sp.]
MRHAWLLAIALFSFSLSAQESEDGANLAKRMLVTGKMSGGCGIMQLQIQYQQNTGLEGGTNFIVRFWTAEAARLGMTLDEYAGQCRRVVENYQEFYEMFDSGE